MEYKGYRIEVRWNHRALGYDFHVYDKEGREAVWSRDSYFYEKNALVAGMEAIDWLLAELPCGVKDGILYLGTAK